MRDTYIAGGESFLLTYAINSLHSYEETASFYKQILRIKDCDSFPIVLVANKCDLEKQRQVPEEQARCVFVDSFVVSFIFVINRDFFFFWSLLFLIRFSISVCLLISVLISVLIR
jgi:GTPase SAR1 family protein